MHCQKHDVMLEFRPIREGSGQGEYYCPECEGERSLVSDVLNASTTATETREPFTPPFSVTKVFTMHEYVCHVSIKEHAEELRDRLNAPTTQSGDERAAEAAAEEVDKYYTDFIEEIVAHGEQNKRPHRRVLDEIAAIITKHMPRAKDPAAPSPATPAVATERETDRLFALSDEEIIAETIAAGEDPVQVATRGRAMLEAVIIANRAMEAAATIHAESQSNSEFQRLLMRGAFAVGAEWQRAYTCLQRALPAAAVLTSEERAAFEAWCVLFGLPTSRNDAGYTDENVYWAWDAWQARAKHTSGPGGVSLTEEERTFLASYDARVKLGLDVDPNAVEMLAIIRRMGGC